MKRFLKYALAIMLVAGVAYGSQTYNSDVFNLVTAWDTLMQRIEDNFAALKSNFSGTSAPSNAEEGQWWADTDDNMIKIYSGSGWVDVFDWSSMSFQAGAGTITAAMISDAARKPSLVTAQAITPSSVAATGNVSGATLSAGATTVSATELAAIDGAVLGNKVIATALLTSGVSYVDFSGIAAESLYQVIGRFYGGPGGATYCRIYVRVNGSGSYQFEIGDHSTLSAASRVYSCYVGAHTGTTSYESRTEQGSFAVAAASLRIYVEHPSIAARIYLIKIG